MQDPPQTRYAKTADGVHIAYQVVGEGPRDLVFAPGLVNHLDFMWQDRNTNGFFSRLAEVPRLILFDKRGTGLSDRDVEVRDLGGLHRRRNNGHESDWLGEGGALGLL